MIPLINYTILTDALHALKEGNIRHCEISDFTFDEMNALNQLSPMNCLRSAGRQLPLFRSVSAMMFCIIYWRRPARNTSINRRLTVLSDWVAPSRC
jgi:hypothetical protein